MNVAIIGAGAAGCFCALLLKRRLPEAQVDVYEGGSKALAKVAITGGGRCNLTNTFRDIRSLQEAYPRGAQLMKRAFCQFDNEATMRWFEAEGVALTVQDDQCVFPRSQDAMQIVHTLLRGMERAGVGLHLRHKVSRIEPLATTGFEISFMADAPAVRADIVIVTTGGSPRPQGLDFLAPLALKIEPPVPSLFSFNISGMSDLMGIVANAVSVRLAGTKFRADGALLITHWGMSGPAILKLSSHAARHLAEVSYRAQLIVNWLADATEDDARLLIEQMQHGEGGKLVANARPSQIPSRLWLSLTRRAGLRPDQRWSEVGRKQTNRLASILTADTYPIEGQSRHKEEFVTCGGISLNELNLNTLATKKHPNLYLAGEVLDVDAITGGFNLQAAWSMAYVVANGVATNSIGQTVKTA
ncbi:MAG: aminoacetone oxidase family FAD-binding enzyme [Bacteroidales bacterium]|nr:aminoacetone oxidase family FAD-binding enzyme [Bacteroidales bacterium]